MGVGQRCARLVRDQSFSEELHLRQGELIDLVISFLVASVGGEEPVLCLSGERDTEIISVAVERCAQIKEHPHHRISDRRVAGCFEQVQTAVTRVAVAGEVECAVGMDVRIHLIGGRVDARSKRLGVDPFAVVQFGTPYILTAYTSGRVTHEIERVAGRIECRVAYGDRAVRKQFHLLRFTPFAAGAVAAVDLSTQVLAVHRLRIRKIHRTSVRRETAHTHLGCAGLLTACGVVGLFLFRGIVQSFRQLDLFPCAGCVLTGLVQLEQLLSRHVTWSFEFLRTAFLLLLPVRSEHERIITGADKHRREAACALGTKLLRFRNTVATCLALPFVDLHARVLTAQRHVVSRVGFEVRIVVFDRLFVLTLVLQHLGGMQIDGRVLQLVLAAQRTLVAVRRFGVVDVAVTLPLTEGDIALQFPIFLRTQPTVALLVHIGRGVVLTDRELLIRPLDPLLYTATRQTQDNGQKAKD